MDTIIALYDNVSHAQQAAERLVGLGIESQQITLIRQEVSAIYDAAREAAASDERSASGRLQQGGALVAVQLQEGRRKKITDVLQQYGLVEAITLESDEAQRIQRAVTPHVQAGDFWLDVEAAFKRHFHANYAAKGYAFKTYEPAYRFGFATAGGDVSGWEEAAFQLQEAWEARFPGDWQQFSAAIHHGWQVARGRRAGQAPEPTELQTTRRGARYRELSEEQ